MTMVWSSDYAPVDGDFDNVSLLLKGEGTNGSTTILDSSSNNLSVTAVDTAQISTAVNTPFGTGDGVLAFDGTGDYLQVSDSVDFALGSEDFTIEAFVYLNSIPPTFDSYTITSKWDNQSAPNDRAYWLRVNDAGLIQWYYSVNGSSASLTLSSTILSANTWYHVCVERSGSVGKIYVNGISEPTQINFGTDIVNNNNVDFRAGAALLGGSVERELDGYLSNVRITKGVARYTSNFTPPTAPLPILSPSGRITIADDSLDADARQYIINVEEQDGQALEPGVRTAINDFVVGCKSDGIWNAIKASCLLSGARTLEGALVPLKGSAPTNNGPFDAADYDRKTGLLGNGSTKYLDSNRSDSADPQNNIHISTWVSALNGGGGLIGTGGGQTPGATHLFADANNNWRFVGRCRSTSNSQITSVTNNYIGFAGISRSIANSFDTRALGSTINSSIASQAATGLNHTVFRRAGSNGFNGRLAFYSIGEDLDLAKLDTRISDFITAIGAAIP
jgi:hypothetical protein